MWIEYILASQKASQKAVGCTWGSRKKIPYGTDKTHPGGQEDCSHVLSSTETGAEQQADAQAPEAAQCCLQ